MIRCKITVFLFAYLFFGLPKLISQSVKVSTFGFETDASRALRAAMASEFDTLLIDKQNRPWTIKPMRFVGIKNKVIILEEGVVILAKIGAFSNKGDALFSFKNCQDIHILGSGATLRMNKDEYTDGEWRHGISLWNCKNIHIQDLMICDSGGDGIYIDGTVKGSFSENISIDRIIATNNKRQGMSIISGRNITVRNSIFEKTIGTLPGAGVDLEPDDKEDRMENICFYDCTFRNNDHAGIVLSLRNLETDSKPVSVGFYSCVLQNNHNKTNRYIASEIVFGAHITKPVLGEVVFEKCIIEDSNWGLFYSRKISSAYSVTFKDCIARNICKDKTYPAMYLEVPDYFTGSYSLGGYRFINLSIFYEADVPLLMVRGSRLNTLENVADIKGDITLYSSSPKGYEYIKYDSRNNEAVDIRLTYMKSENN